MEISTACHSASLPVAQKATTASSSSAKSLPALPADRVSLSDTALDSARNPSLRLVTDALGVVLGDTVEGGQVAPDGGDAGDYLAGSYRQERMSAEAVSLSAGGTVSGQGGNQMDYTLDLDHTHVSLATESADLQVNRAGLTGSYSAAAAEFSSTSFGFTLTSTGEQGGGLGKGGSHLNDELSRIAKELKPAAKEFMAAAGLRGGWGEVNRFLRSVS